MEILIKLLKKFFNRKKEKIPAPDTSKSITPVIIPRSAHGISRNHIDPDALKVLYRLHNNHFSAYLVGGCVRDLLLGRSPKDFDIATNARPEEVRKIFRNCRLIGKRFRLAHVFFGQHIVEVATFRTHHGNATHTQHAKMQDGMILRDNVYGSIEDDVLRRDFTVNALYYNIADFSIVDYMNGMPDIHSKTLRILGDAEARYHEDPVRLLRAARFAGKLNLVIDPKTESLMLPLAPLLQNVAPARLYQEVLKFFHEGATCCTFKLLQKYDLFKELFPDSALSLKENIPKKFIELALAQTDERIKENKSVSPAFLFSAFLWHPLLKQIEKNEKKDMPRYVALEEAIQVVLKKQTQRLTIPRQIQASMSEIFLLQYRLEQQQGSHALRLLSHPRFRAGYDFLELRSQAGEVSEALSQWWKAFYEANPEARQHLLKKSPAHSTQKRKRHFRRRRH